jgi:chromosome segregation ATPase
VRVTVVKKAQKEVGHCGKCRTAIHKGDGYQWIKFRRGGTRTRCLKTECKFTRSDMTTSDKLSQLYAAQETAHHDLASAFDSLDDVRTILDECGSVAESVAEEYRESAQNIEDGFGHATSTSEEIGEKADACDAWKSELEGALDSSEEFDENAARAEIEQEKGADEELTDDEMEERLKEKREEWREEVRETAQEAIDSLDL